MAVRYYTRRLPGEALEEEEEGMSSRTVVHNLKETVGLEIHVRMNDFRHDMFEEHIFYSQKSYRKFIQKNMKIGTCTDRSWFVTSTTVVLNESYDFNLKGEE